MSASSPLQLPSNDKLDVLRYLDEFRYWHSLDDERLCQRCQRTITGRQIVVIELQGTRGRIRVQCPTAGCASTVSEWVYANPVQAAQNRAGSSLPKQHEKGPAAIPRSQRKRIFAAASSFRELAARLRLLRPIATALHAFHPVA
jgi:hypothetical protein